VELLKEDSKHALTVLNQLNKQLQDLEEEQSETRETLEEAGVDLTEYEQKLKEEAWKNIWDEAEENL
jgi:septal ring factor EnvC (AmiA/AmiB activator)